jgi:ATP-dependent DNA ligase
MSCRAAPSLRFIQPHLSLLVKAAPASADWAHELKYDGYRIHALLAYPTGASDIGYML